MSIIIHGPGVHDPYPLGMPAQEGGPAATQPVAAVRAITEEGGPTAQAAARLRAAIDAMRERKDAPARGLRAGDLGHKDALLLPGAMPLPEARERLELEGLDEAMVVDEGGRLSGLLELRGLLKAVWPPGEVPRTGLDGLRVGDVCRRPVDALREDAPLELMVRLMLDRGYAALPVVDEEGHPVSLVRMSDLLPLVLGGPDLDAWA